jgi:hypothetical protein
MIETTGLSPLNPIGPNMRGPLAKVIERWQLKRDEKFGEVLVVDIEQIDPNVYVKSAHAHNEMRRAPAGTAVGGYGCSAALWDDWVEKVESSLATKKKSKR